MVSCLIPCRPCSLSTWCWLFPNRFMKRVVFSLCPFDKHILMSLLGLYSLTPRNELRGGISADVVGWQRKKVTDGLPSPSGSPLTASRVRCSSQQPVWLPQDHPSSSAHGETDRLLEQWSPGHWSGFTFSLS